MGNLEEYYRGKIEGAAFVYDTWTNMYNVLATGASKHEVVGIESDLNLKFDTVRSLIYTDSVPDGDYNKGVS